MNGSSDRLRVLVVQEDLVLARALKDELEKENCVVRHVATASEAEQLLLDVAAEQPYQLVITAVRLRESMGHDWMAHLAQVMPNGRPPFVLTKGFGYDPDSVQRPWRHALGPRDSLLYVPFRLDDLRQAVNRALGSLGDGSFDAPP